MQHQYTTTQSAAAVGTAALRQSLTDLKTQINNLINGLPSIQHDQEAIHGALSGIIESACNLPIPWNPETADERKENMAALAYTMAECHDRLSDEELAGAASVLRRERNLLGRIYG